MPNVELATTTGIVTGVRVHRETIKGDALASIAITRIGSRCVDVALYDRERPVTVRLSRKSAAVLAVALATAAGVEP